MADGRASSTDAIDFTARHLGAALPRHGLPVRTAPSQAEARPV